MQNHAGTLAAEILAGRRARVALSPSRPSSMRATPCVNRQYRKGGHGQYGRPGASARWTNGFPICASWSTGKETVHNSIYRAGRDDAGDRRRAGKRPKRWREAV